MQCLYGFYCLSHRLLFYLLLVQAYKYISSLLLLQLVPVLLVPHWCLVFAHLPSQSCLCKLSVPHLHSLLFSPNWSHVVLSPHSLSLPSAPANAKLITLDNLTFILFFLQWDNVLELFFSQASHSIYFPFHLWFHDKSFCPPPPLPFILGLIEQKILMKVNIVIALHVFSLLSLVWLWSSLQPVKRIWMSGQIKPCLAGWGRSLLMLLPSPSRRCCLNGIFSLPWNSFLSLLFYSFLTKQLLSFLGCIKRVIAGAAEAFSHSALS